MALDSVKVCATLEPELLPLYCIVTWQGNFLEMGRMGNGQGELGACLVAES